MLHEAERLLEHVRGSGSVLLTGPEGPDGDSIGACLALRRILHARAPGVRVDVAGTPGHRYAWLPDAGEMIPDGKVGGYDGVVVLDGDRRRLPPEVARAFADAAWTAIVDHHVSTDVTGYDVALFEPRSESTCAMIHTLAKGWGVGIDEELAELLYAGIIFDTGGFRYSNTRASTHRIAAELLETGIDHARISLKVLMERRPPALRLLARMLDRASFHAGGRMAVAICTRALLGEVGASESDLEGIVDVLQHTEGVDLAVVVVERGSTKVKLSLRSSGRMDVAALARSLHENGGGHAKAAGVVLHEPLEAVLARLHGDVAAQVAALA